MTPEQVRLIRDAAQRERNRQETVPFWNDLRVWLVGYALWFGTADTPTWLRLADFGVVAFMAYQLGNGDRKMFRNGWQLAALIALFLVIEVVLALVRALL